MLYMSLEIFKICYLKDNKNYKIQVFNGDTNYSQQNILELYKTDKIDKTIFNDIFNEVERNDILENNTPVFFMPTFIYIDDTIETIKKKIIKHNPFIAFEEIYLYASKEIKMNNT